MWAGCRFPYLFFHILPPPVTASLLFYAFRPCSFSHPFKINPPGQFRSAISKHLVQQYTVYFAPRRHLDRFILYRRTQVCQTHRVTVSQTMERIQRRPVPAGIPDPTRIRGYGSGRVNALRVRVGLYPLLSVKKSSQITQ